jgi:hypothetical protein
MDLPPPLEARVKTLAQLNMLVGFLVGLGVGISFGYFVLG